MTLISLIIGGVLFIFAVTFSSSIDELAYSRQGIFQNSEYNISFTEEINAAIERAVDDTVTMVYIQRSRGYELRPSLLIEEIEKVKANKAFNVKMEYKGEISDDTISPMDNSHTVSAEKAVIAGTGEIKEK